MAVKGRPRPHQRRRDPLRCGLSGPGHDAAVECRFAVRQTIR